MTGFAKIWWALAGCWELLLLAAIVSSSPGAVLTLTAVQGLLAAITWGVAIVHVIVAWTR